MAEEWLRHRGGWGIFLSRWLLTPLGPFVNITSGLSGYSWPRFLFYDILGEALWVTLYVLLGKFFSDSVEEIGDMLGDLTWTVVGLLFALLLGWTLWRQLRASPPPTKELKATGSAFD